MAKKKSTKILSVVTNILLVVCLAVFGYSSYRIFAFQISRRVAAKEHDSIYNIIDIPTPSQTDGEEDNTWKFTADSWKKLKEQNSDFQMFLRFDSGIISESVMQASNNDYYLRRSFYETYSEVGIPFMDFRCSTSDTNMTIYGHLVYYDNTLMFSPLTLLTDQVAFWENNTLKIYLEDEIRSYQVAYVYHYQLTDYDEYDYVVGNFSSKEAFERYMNYPKSHNMVYTGIEIEYGDRFVTFQTCVKYHEEQRLIVVAKEISREPYPVDPVAPDKDAHLDAGEENTQTDGN